MRIAVLGGGPAGLYFAYLWKRAHKSAEVVLFEQNEAAATFGFGVVFSDRAMDFIRNDDPDTADAITDRMESWSDMTLIHRDERVAIDGVGFSAIGRLELLRLLQARASGAGAELRFGTHVAAPADLDGFDLIVAADGVNSTARRWFEDEFGTSLSHHDMKFAWFGASKPFDTLTQTFVETDHGAFNAHHYRYTPERSTFIVECSHNTWLSAGFDRHTEEESRGLCESFFAATLNGGRLLTNKSSWRSFPWVWNMRWSARNVVLLGDALHTAHYSIGSGTRLAMEDAIALVRALERHPNALSDALQTYEAERKPIVEKIVTASKASAAWYSDFANHMRHAPLDFAHAYITRSGRISDDRLRAMAPRFMARYDAERRAA